MDKYYREREFDYRIAMGLIVYGTVSGRILPAERDVDSEVADFKIDARVYTHILDDIGIPLEGYGMNQEMRKTIEAFALNALCEESS